MPRTRRIIPDDAVLHVMCRGNNRQDVFHNDSDKLRYYTLLRDLKTENKVEVFHYCLMNNHIHVVLAPQPENTLSKFMKQVNLTYFHYYRKRYGYAGHLWQGRFKSNVIEMDSYLLQCGKYIELNPVRAGIVNHSGDYLFSSYRFYAEGKSDALVTPSPAYLGLASAASARQKQYVEFFIDSDIINSAQLAGKLFIGSQVFIDRCQEYYQIKNQKGKRGRPLKREK
ncbi:MAG: transposase [Candidatus Omnitrophota bacterium]|jgi:putative transposase